MSESIKFKISHAEIRYNGVMDDVISQFSKWVKKMYSPEVCNDFMEKIKQYQPQNITEDILWSALNEAEATQERRAMEGIEASDFGEMRFNSE